MASVSVSMDISSVDISSVNISNVVLSLPQDHDVLNVYMDLTTNADFLKNLDQVVKNIQNNGKIEVGDVPNFVYLIMDSYNSLSKSKLTTIKLPMLVQSVFNFIITKYSLLSHVNLHMIENIIVASIKLVMMVPIVKNEVEKIASKCVCW